MSTSLSFSIDVNDLLDGMCANARRIVAYVSAVSLVGNIFDVLLGDHVEADNAAVGGLVEPFSIYVHNVDQVVVRLHMFVSFVLVVRVLVRGVDKCKVNCLSSFVNFEAAWNQPPCLMAISCFASPTWYKSFAQFSHGFLREEIRLKFGL